MHRLQAFAKIVEGDKGAVGCAYAPAHFGGIGIRQFKQLIALRVVDDGRSREVLFVFGELPEGLDRAFK